MITLGEIVVDLYSESYEVLLVTLRASRATQLHAILNSLTSR
jgi:hypothetical protein